MGRTDAPDAPSKSFTIRSYSHIAAVGVIGLTVLVCLTIVFVMHFFHIAAVRERDISQDLRSAESIQAGLLYYARVNDLVALKQDNASQTTQIGAEAQIRRHIDSLRARATIDTDPRRTLVDDIDRTALAYFAAQRTAEKRETDLRQVIAATNPALQSAVEATRKLGHYEEGELDAASNNSRRINRFGMILGLVVSLLAVGSVLVAKGYFDRFIRDPLLDFAKSVVSFAHGDRRKRAHPQGVQELIDAAENFNDMAETLAEQHTRMGEFLERVTGDLRGPIGVVRAAIAELLPGRPAPTLERVHAHASSAARSLEHIDQKVSYFVEAHRVLMARLDLHLEKRDVREFVRHSVALFETEAHKHHIMLSVPDEPLVVECDPSHISQATGSLVSQAIGRSPEGGVVDVKVAREGALAVIDVTDHGSGIPAADLERFFSPLERESGRPGGSVAAGVELSAARRVIEAHGGRIDIESKVGEGSTFHIRLPLAQANGEKSAEGSVH